MSHERKHVTISQVGSRYLPCFLSMACRVLFPATPRAIRPFQHISRPITFSFVKLASTSAESSVINSKMSQNGEAAPSDVPDKDKWKYRAPYRIHEKNEHFDTKHEGECHCGKVKFQLSREAPLASKLCHCTTCQLQHAAPFQWAAIFHKEDINFAHGHHNLEWYDPTTKSTEHQLPCKVRCAYCHSPIMDEGRNMILLFPSLIKLETQKAKDDFKPQ